MSPPIGTGGGPISPAGYARILLRTVAMAALLFVCVPLFYLWAPFTDHNPWPRRFLRSLARVLGVRVQVVGTRPAQKALLLSNHVSWLDIAVLAGTTGTAFVAHDGLAAHPGMRWIASLNDTVFIARERRGTVARQVEQVREALSETGALTIFPEGTTGDGEALLPFKSALLSAFSAFPADIAIAVHPVWIDYGASTREIAWGNEPGIVNFRRIAARSRFVRARVHILPELEGEPLEHRKAMAVAARRAIEGAMAARGAPDDQRVAL